MLSVQCPFCNAQFDLDPSQAASPRLVCIRCGESFSHNSTEISAQVPRSDTSLAVSPMKDHPPTLAGQAQRPVSNRMLGLLILAGMSVMATLGLAFMLLTQESRRANDLHKPPKYEVLHVPLLGRLLLSAYLAGLAYFVIRGALPGVQQQDDVRLRTWRLGLGGILVLLAAVLPFLLQTRPAPQAPEVAPVRSVPAGELEGLGYLPTDVDAVAGVHVAEAMKSEAGRALAKLAIGQTDLAVDTLADWLGVRPDEIDHIVAGLRQTEVYIVVRTRKPYDRQRVTSYKKFEVREDPAASASLQLYQCEMKVFGKVTLDAKFLCADARTLLVFLNVETKKIARITIPAPSGSDHLPAQLRDLLHEETATDKQLWFAARSSAFKSPFALLFRPVTEDISLAKLSDLAVWASFSGSEVKVQSDIDCTDEASAQALEAKLAKQAAYGSVSREDRRVTWRRSTTADKLLEGMRDLHVKPGG